MVTVVPSKKGEKPIECIKVEVLYLTKQEVSIQRNEGGKCFVITLFALRELNEFYYRILSCDLTYPMSVSHCEFPIKLNLMFKLVGR